MIKICEYCGKAFETPETKDGMRKRFCNTSCSAYWRIKTFGVPKLSDAQRQVNSEHLKSLWKNPDFRKKKTQYMIDHNPVHIPGVVEKANKTRLSKGPLPNNFRYGNGKVSKYENLAFEKLRTLGFYYNYAINTKLARDAFPEQHFANHYKPDFVNLQKHLCIEIDGDSHNSAEAKERDKKKTECLKFLGFETVRFTHSEIDKGEFDKWLSLYRENN